MEIDVAFTPLEAQRYIAMTLIYLSWPLLESRGEVGVGVEVMWNVGRFLSDPILSPGEEY